MSKNIESKDPASKGGGSGSAGGAGMLSKYTSKDIKNIVKRTEEGFSINMKNMIQNKSYYMKYMDSKYVFYKNPNDELVMTEIP